MPKEDLSSKTLEFITKKSKELSKRKEDERSHFKRKLKRLERKNRELEKAKRIARRIKEARVRDDIGVGPIGIGSMGHTARLEVRGDNDLINQQDLISNHSHLLSNHNQLVMNPSQMINNPSQMINNPSQMITNASQIYNNPSQLYNNLNPSQLTIGGKNPIVIKKALVIGINYIGTVNQLNTSINDTQNLNDLLTMRNYFKQHEITFMTDNHIGTPLYPTKANIMTQLEALVNIAQKNPEIKLQLLICYSGRGGYIGDHNNASDKRPEVLCPIDHASSGYILSEDLSSQFLSKLHNNVEVIFLIDAGHKAPILDLRYNPTLDNKDRVITYGNHAELDANIVLLSGIKESTSDNVSAEQKSNIPELQNAITSSFITCYKRDSNYKNLVHNMRSWLKQKRYGQTVDLSSSKSIDTNGLFMLANLASAVL